MSLFMRVVVRYKNAMHKEPIEGLKVWLLLVKAYSVYFIFLQKYLYNKYSLIYIYLYMLINIKHIYICLHPEPCMIACILLHDYT